MRLLIDTCAYSALLAGDRRVADELGAAEVVLLSPIVIGELYDGFTGGRREGENRRLLATFCQKPRTSLVPITDATAEWFANLKQQLKRKGTPLPINDVWIAASCLEHGACLLSLDRHFSAIDGLLLHLLPPVAT